MGCEYNGINLTTKKVNCSCSVKTSITTELNDFSFNNLGEKFKTVLSESNIKVVKCYKLVFNSNNLLKNIGSWVIIGITISEVILVILYTLNGINPITKQLELFFESIIQRSDQSPTFCIDKSINKRKHPKSTSEEIIQINPLSNPPNKKKPNLKKANPQIKKEVKINIEKNIGFHFDCEQYQYFENPGKPKILEQTFSAEKNSKTSFCLDENEYPDSPVLTLPQNSIRRKRNNISVLNQSFGLESEKSRKTADIFEEKDLDKSKKTSDTFRDGDTIIKYTSNELSSKQVLNTFQSEKGDIEKRVYTNEELNKMSYNDAILHDNRSFCRYYYSILCYGQLILFTFVLKTDYNLKLLKISMFFFGLAMYIAFNTLFYTDSTMSHYYQNKGVIEIIYSLPKTIFSTLFCVIITFLLKQLSLSQSNMQAIKEEKDLVKAKMLSRKFIKCLKIKISIFYTILFIFLFIFWYYIAAFCAVYKNTQKHLLKDSLMSFCLSMIYPFIICLVTASFRRWGLSSKSKCLFRISKILQLFS